MYIKNISEMCECCMNGAAQIKMGISVFTIQITLLNSPHLSHKTFQTETLHNIRPAIQTTKGDVTSQLNVNLAML